MHKRGFSDKTLICSYAVFSLPPHRWWPGLSNPFCLTGGGNRMWRVFCTCQKCFLVGAQWRYISRSNLSQAVTPTQCFRTVSQSPPTGEELGRGGRLHPNSAFASVLPRSETWCALCSVHLVKHKHRAIEGKSGPVSERQPCRLGAQTLSCTWCAHANFHGGSHFILRLLQSSVKPQMHKGGALLSQGL